MPTILVSAPYLLASLDRFRPVLERYGFSLLTPAVQERLEETELMMYAGQFDGALCGDDCYSARVLQACLPRLKVLSKWGTGIDSIDAEAADRFGIREVPSSATISAKRSGMPCFGSVGVSP